MKKNKKPLIISLLFAFSIISFCIASQKTYTSYESLVNNNINVDIADWIIKIDEQDISTTTQDIKLSNIEWESTHANPKTAAPGSKGKVKINIDPTNNDVAIEYTIKYFDKNLASDCVLTVNNIYLEDEELLQINENTYSGIITMDEIKNNETKVLVLEIEWVNDENNNEIDSEIGLNKSEVDFLKLEFTATQYIGE